jgi:hypothetical protein
MVYNCLVIFLAIISCLFLTFPSSLSLYPFHLFILYLFIHPFDCPFYLCTYSPLSFLPFDFFFFNFPCSLHHQSYDAFVAVVLCILEVSILISADSQQIWPIFFVDFFRTFRKLPSCYFKINLPSSFYISVFHILPCLLILSIWV